MNTRIYASQTNTVVTSTIRELPASAEFCLVLLVCFWWWIYSNSVAIIRYASGTPSVAQEHYAGIGVELGDTDNQVTIMQVLPGTPAAEAGLSAGSVIWEIDGIATAGRQAKDCGNMVRGLPGSHVRLELVDHGQTNVVELTRRALQGAPKPLATNHSALLVIIFEIIGLAAMFWIARVRGWPLGAWGLRPSWKLTGMGVLLFLVLVCAMAALAMLANGIFPGIAHKYSMSVISLPVVVIFSVINGVFEEIVESGYFIQSLQKYGMWTAILASAGFRTFLHAYQGPTALIMILPLGLVFAFIYWRWRRLWPLFIAHMLFDFVAFVSR